MDLSYIDINIEIWEGMRQILFAFNNLNSPYLVKNCFGELKHEI